MNWDTWGPPLVVLAIGAVAGLIVALRMRGAGRAVGPGTADLVARKDLLIEQLAELEADRAKLEPEAFQARREALVGEAAAALRSAEGATPSEGATFGAVSTPAPVPSSRRWPIWAAATVAFFGVLAWGLSKSTSPRESEMGAAAASSRGSSQGEATAAPSARAVEAARTLESNPTDLSALNALTHDAIDRRDLQGAMGYLDRARAVDPNDPEVLTHLAVLQVAVGMDDRAATGLDQALAAKSDFGEARVWRAALYWRAGDSAKAEEMLVEVLHGTSDPESRQIAASLLMEVRGGPAGPVAAATASDSVAPTTGDPRVSGSIALATGASPPAGGSLFVIARRSEAGGGPPAAVARMAPTSFPVDFALGDGNLMMGGAWPDEAWLQARLDADGNPTTHGDGDLESAVVRVTPGTSGLALVLSP